MVSARVPFVQCAAEHVWASAVVNGHRMQQVAAQVDGVMVAKVPTVTLYRIV